MNLEIDAEFPKKLLPEIFRHHDYKVLHGGRGGGKSWAIARALLILGMKRKLRILCARETQRSIRDSVHKLLVDQIARLDIARFYFVQQVKITGLNGTEFTFTGLSDQTADSLKSFEAADVCWVEEGHVVSDHSWTILLPTLFRVQDCELWVSFNPELDTDPTWRIFIEHPPTDTWSCELNWQDNPFFPPELDKVRLHQQATMSPEDYSWVWEGKCRPAAHGAIYTREMQALEASGRVTLVPPDPALRTHTVWDIGFTDHNAIILVQSAARELRVIDYIEDRYLTLIDYCNQLKDKGLNWGTDYVPWDAADERYQFTNPNNSPQGMLRTAGRSVQVVPRADVETGILRARTVFPRCYFDREKTLRLRECLKRYKRVIPATTGEPSHPMHDEYSHGADAFRYLAMVADQLGNEAKKPIKYPQSGYA